MAPVQHLAAVALRPADLSCQPCPLLVKNRITAHTLLKHTLHNRLLFDLFPAPLKPIDMHTCLLFSYLFCHFTAAEAAARHTLCTLCFMAHAVHAVLHGACWARCAAWHTPCTVCCALWLFMPMDRQPLSPCRCAGC